MKHLYFDLISGASGDMILAALIDLGVALDYLREEFSRISIEGLKIDYDSTRQSGILCKKMKLSWDMPAEWRHPQQILQLIYSGGYHSLVTKRCEKIINNLAAAEAAVHGIAVEKVHFHEIGAVDTIVDILGFSLCLQYLGIEKIEFSTLISGRGTVVTQHGIMPVPAPATTRLMQGFDVKLIPLECETLTPTGCAILTSVGVQRPMHGVVERVGYGCGQRDLGTFPNMIRAIVFERKSDEEEKSEDVNTVTVIESDMDHISGEIMAFVAEALLAQGAIDVSWTPILMKKGRPAYRLSVLAAPQTAQMLADVIMKHTRTLGVRMHLTKRIVGVRESQDSEFLGMQIKEKKCIVAGHAFTKIEYESLAELARSSGRSILELAEEYIKGSGKVI